MVEVINGFIILFHPEMDIADLIPVLRIIWIDFDGLLVGTDGLIVPILFIKYVAQSDPGVYEALVEFDCLFLVSDNCIENLA